MFVNNLQVGLANYYITIWAAATTTTLAWISARISNNNVSLIPKEVNKLK
jgi:hypothetical protein